MEAPRKPTPEQKHQSELPPPTKTTMAASATNTATVDTDNKRGDEYNDNENENGVTAKINSNNNIRNHQNTNIISIEDLAALQQKKADMMADEDPLLISQSLTYVTDDGGILHSFHSAPFAMGMCLCVFARMNDICDSRYDLQSRRYS